MKRHLTASAVRIGRRSNGSSGRGLAGHGRSALSTGGRPQAPAKEQGFRLTSVSAWTHTLILTGELTDRSAYALEVEIERLCEEGVTDITLDLRELTHIDPVGVAVIAFRCGLCEKRGYGFRLIRGSRAVHRAFEQAGLGDLPFQEDDIAAARLGALGHRSLDACER